MTQASAQAEDSGPKEASSQSASAGAAPIGSAVLRGSFWMVLNSLVTRLASLLAIIFLGNWLNDHDFGVYGLAISMSALAGVLRDGGVRQLLFQRQKEYETLLGPVFWMALTFNSATGLILAALAPVLAKVYGEPETLPLLLVIAAAQPLATPGVMYQASLGIHMRFGAVAMIQAISGVIRFGGAIVLAWRGVGPMSFVIPIPVSALFEWAAGAWLTREQLWRRGANVGSWPGMFALSVWVLLGTFGIAVMNWGANPAIKLFGAETEMVGAYFFAYQIVVQVGILLSSNVNQVLFAAMTKIAAEPERLAQAALRSLRQVMLLAALLSVGLAVTFAPLETIVWKGSKAACAPAVLWLGALYPLSVALAVPLAVQQARGRFKAWAMGLLATSAVSLTGAVIGASLHKTPEGVAIWSGAATSIATLTYAYTILRGLGVSLYRTCVSALPAWVLSIIAGYGAWVFGERIASQPALIRFVLIGMVFTLLFVLLVRVGVKRHLLDTINVMPARLRGPAKRVLLLSESAQ